MRDESFRRASYEILKEVCAVTGDTYEEIAGSDGWLARVRRGPHSFLFRSTAYPLNAGWAAAVVRDKTMTYALLASRGYAVPAGAHFFVRTAAGRDAAAAYAMSRGWPVFVKPNALSEATLARRFDDAEELPAHLAAIAQLDEIALVQKVLTGQEFRFFVCDGRVVYVAERELSPEKGMLHVKQLITDVPPEAAGYAVIVAREMALRVCSVDVFATRGLDPTGFTICEVNAHPSLRRIFAAGYRDLAVTIWREMLDTYFAEAAARDA